MQTKDDVRWGTEGLEAVDTEETRGKANGDAKERRNAEGARRVVISVRAEGADMQRESQNQDAHGRR